MHKTFLTILCIFFTTLLFSQPEWLNVKQRNILFPADRYYTACTEASFDRNTNPDELIKSLGDRNAAHIASNIYVKIESQASNQIDEKRRKVSSNYSQSVTAYTNLELIGIQHKSYIDEGSKNIYVLSFIDKKQLNDYYLNHYIKGITDLKSKLNIAEEQLRQNDHTNAAKTSESIQYLLTSCESEALMLLALGFNAQQNVNMDDLLNDKQRYLQVMLKLTSGENFSINDLAYSLAQSLNSQLKNRCNIKVAYPTFADTRYSSPFAKQFAQMLTSQLSANPVYTMVENPLTNDLVIAGKYWEEGENIVMTLSVSTINGRLCAAANGIIKKNYLVQSGIAYKAENFADAYSRMQEFNKDEIVNSDLQPEIWTNKGNDNLLFQKDEIMQLYVRVNQPCYLRVVYFMADETKVLLLDNFYIDQTKVNKVVEIPNKFKCAAPFGFETIQLAASQKAFNPLSIQLMGKYKLIVENTSTIIKKTRGMIDVTEELPQDKPIYAETQLNLTTYQ